MQSANIRIISIDEKRHLINLFCLTHYRHLVLVILSSPGSSYCLVMHFVLLKCVRVLTVLYQQGEGSDRVGQLNSMAIQPLQTEEPALWCASA